MNLVDSFLIFVLIGFFAQLINGALGMSYGTISVTFLLSLGVPPVLASTSVHISKATTGFVSGFSHWKLGNVDKKLTAKLLISGVFGAIIGAFVLLLLPEGILKPVISIYLMFTGLNILWHAFRKALLKTKQLPLLPLGAIGGFVDAVGGGGWGPVVTSTLLSNGYEPHSSIGSVSLAEAFVASAVVVVLMFRVSLAALSWQITLGLMLGGIVAAPLAAILCERLPTKSLMAAVGLLVLILSSSMLWVSLR